MGRQLIYLSGPMQGYPDYNYPTFNQAAARLRELGWDVINPAETAGGITHLPRETFIRMDMGYILASDILVLLPGWMQSQGAKLEMMLAHNLDLPIYKYSGARGLGVQVILQNMVPVVDFDAYPREHFTRKEIENGHVQRPAATASTDG